MTPIFGPDRKPSHILSISRDISEERRTTQELSEAVERQVLLSGELQHRIKNTLAMVGAIANQTMRGDSVTAAREAFAARLLTQTSWNSAPIKDVVAGALAPHLPGKNRIGCSGPDVHLLPKQALALAIAIHELATNAVKYGSLSTNGPVELVWSNDISDRKTGFRFGWTERGGPNVIEPDAGQKGFGSRLIEKMLANDFAGTVRILYRPTGVVCELEAPSLEVADDTAG